MPHGRGEHVEGLERRAVGRVEVLDAIAVELPHRAHVGLFAWRFGAEVAQPSRETDARRSRREDILEISVRHDRPPMRDVQEDDRLQVGHGRRGLVERRQRIVDADGAETIFATGFQEPRPQRRSELRGIIHISHASRLQA